MVRSKRLALVLVLVLVLDEDVVRVLDKKVALVLVLVLPLEEDVARTKGYWRSGHSGPCPEYLHLHGPQCLPLQVVLALEEAVAGTTGHSARRHYAGGAGGKVSNPLARQRFGGSKRGSKDTDGGACQRGA